MAILRDTVEPRCRQGLTSRAVNTKSHAAVRAEFIVDPAFRHQRNAVPVREPEAHKAKSADS